MRIIIPFFLALAACATPETSTVEQGLCQLDPTTGQCAANTPDGVSAAASEGYAWDNYQPDTVDNASCTAASGNALCQVSLYVGGASVMLYCSAQYVLRNGRWTVVGLSCGTR